MRKTNEQAYGSGVVMTAGSQRPITAAPSAGKRIARSTAPTVWSRRRPCLIFRCPASSTTARARMPTCPAKSTSGCATACAAAKRCFCLRHARRSNWRGKPGRRRTEGRIRHEKEGSKAADLAVRFRPALAQRKSMKKPRRAEPGQDNAA